MHDFVYLQLSAMQPDHNSNIFSCCMAVGKQTFASDSEYLCQMTYLTLPLCGTVTWQHSCERKQFAILEIGHVHSAFILKGAPTICKCSWTCNMKAVERTYILLGVRVGHMPPTSRSANKEHEKPVCMKLIGDKLMCIFTYCFQGNSMPATHTRKRKTTAESIRAVMSASDAGQSFKDISFFFFFLFQMKSCMKREYSLP